MLRAIEFRSREAARRFAIFTGWKEKLSSTLRFLIVERFDALRSLKQFFLRDVTGKSIQRRYCHENRIPLRAQQQTAQGIPVGDKSQARLSEWFILKKSYSRS